MRVACAYAAQPGVPAAMHLAWMLQSEFRPKTMAMTGICGGVGASVALGDVVIAQKSWDWQTGKWMSSGELASEIEQCEASADLVAAASGVDLSCAYHGYPGAKPANSPAVLVAPMVTGSGVVANETLHGVMRGPHRKAAAVDMECFGFYYAVNASPNPRPDVICIKSVSDLANSGKSDEFHSFCSAMSAEALRLALVRQLSLRTT